MEVGETHAFVVQAVQVRRLEDRIAKTGDVAIALIVGEDEDQVWGAALGEPE